MTNSWMRNRNAVEFLGIWEQSHSPNFKGVEFDTFKKQAGLNSLRLTPYFPSLRGAEQRSNPELLPLKSLDCFALARNDGSGEAFFYFPRIAAGFCWGDKRSSR